MQNNTNSCLVVSNDSDKLFEALFERLFQGNPFTPRIVIVPAPQVKKQILFQLAQKSPWGIGAGIQFFSLQQFLAFLLEKTQKEKLLLSEVELSLLLENALRTPKSDPIWDPILSYLTPTRISPFAKRLSGQFLECGIFGIEGLEGWQAALWNTVFNGPWTYPLEVCQEELPYPHPVHLFGFSYLPPLFRSFFKQLHSFFYLLSPSPLFLGDLFSDREASFLEKKGVPVDSSTHRVLANLGKRKRLMFSLLEEDGHTLDERYVENEAPATLLETIQSSMFHLAHTPASPDDSLQLHAAPSKQKEVEVLRDHILLFAAQGIPLSEMSVLIPSLDDYRPYFTALLSEGEVPIPFTFVCENRPASREALLDLLALKESRFESEDLLKLFTYPSFTEKCGLDEIEASQFCSWIRKTNLRWGYDSAHRKEILQAESDDIGTWEWAFDLLLLGLARNDTSPYISLVEAEALGKGILAIQHLKESLAQFSLEEERPLSTWITFLHQTFDRFFDQEDNSLMTQLELLSQKIGDLSLPYPSFTSLVTELLNEHSTIGSSNLQAVSFAPLREGNIPHASVIFLLGMHEGAFPRREPKNPFLSSIKEKPNRIEADRNLFLDVLLQAKDALVVSYVNISDDDGKEIAPSPLIQELQNHYPLSTTIHSHTPIHKKKSTPLTSLNQEPCPEIVISIHALKKCARHPIQFFLNETLSIYFEREESGNEEFVLSHLEKGRIRKTTLTRPFDDVLSEEIAKGSLPLWHFTSVAKELLREEIEAYQTTLRSLNVTPSSLFSITFQEGIPAPLIKEKTILLPPLSVELGAGRRARIIGTLNDLTPNGLLFHGKSTLEDLAKVWPAFLIFQCAHLPDVQEKNLLLTKSGNVKPLYIEDPLSALRRYLLYFERAKREPGPFLPEWADSLLNDDEASFQKKMSQAEEEKKDPYLEWLFSTTTLPSTLFSSWAPHLQEVMHGIV